MRSTWAWVLGLAIAAAVPSLVRMNRPPEVATFVGRSLALTVRSRAFEPRGPTFTLEHRVLELGMVATSCVGRKDVVTVGDQQVELPCSTGRFGHGCEFVLGATEGGHRAVLAFASEDGLELVETTDEGASFSHLATVPGIPSDLVSRLTLDREIIALEFATPEPFYLSQYASPVSSLTESFVPESFGGRTWFRLVSTDGGRHFRLAGAQ
ncbi:MAG: hypothetical protein U0228_20530 [Myxococcaceae bacterium]